MSEKLKIIDLPGCQAQIHIHTDETGDYIYSGNVKSYGDKKGILLDNYALAMADLAAEKLGIKTIDK